MTARNVQTAIVLQGGGALGAYHYNQGRAGGRVTDCHPVTDSTDL